MQSGDREFESAMKELPSSLIELRTPFRFNDILGCLIVCDYTMQ